MSDWIEWKGGECPVPPDTIVKIRTRRGTFANMTAGYLEWRHRADIPHISMAWSGSEQSDIVAYRVLSEAPEPDPVNSPPHYTDGGIEAIDYIEAKLGPDGFKAYCVGSALDYISRAGKKGSAKEDLSKAIWYLRRAGGG